MKRKESCIISGSNSVETSEGGPTYAAVVTEPAGPEPLIPLDTKVHYEQIDINVTGSEKTTFLCS